MRPTLRDCPFCATKGDNDEKIFFYKNVVVCHECEYVSDYSIVCTECGVDLHGEYEDDLVNRWNGVKPDAGGEDV